MKTKVVNLKVLVLISCQVAVRRRLRLYAWFLLDLGYRCCLYWSAVEADLADHGLLILTAHAVLIYLLVYGEANLEVPVDHPLVVDP